MTNYATGRRFEWKRRDHWESLGYVVVRSAGSKSPIDLVAFSPTGGVLAIQCKVVQTEADASRLVVEFRNNPPLPLRGKLGPTQMMEVYIRKTKRVESAWF